nr:MAG TPA: hypothetical protein [Caudoviricetes sp.]
MIYFVGILAIVTPIGLITYDYIVGRIEESKHGGRPFGKHKNTSDKHIR